MSREEAVPEFATAARRLGEFLVSKGHSEEVAWVFREDFYAPRLGQCYCRWPLPRENKNLAQAYYDLSRQRGFGVCLVVQFTLHGRSAVSLWAPNSNLDAQYSLVSGLKLTVPKSRVEATAVASSLAWWLHRLSSAYRLNQRQGFDIPLRSAMQAWAQHKEGQSPP